MDVGGCCWVAGGDDQRLLLLLLLLVVVEAVPQLIDVDCGESGVEDMPPVGLDAGWRGWENWVAVGAMGWKLARSGVTVLKPGCWALTAPNLFAGVAAGAAGGVDQEKAAVGVDFLLPEVGDVSGAFVTTLSHPASMGLAGAPLGPPLTRDSKSVSVAPFASKDAPATGPKDMKSSFRADPLASPPDSSCSFLVCSSSTLLESDLMSSMKAWNCLRSRSGPKLMLQRIGRISMAANSASATLPITRRALSAAIITAGSLVLIALIRGTIFSCIVNLSRAVDEVAFFFCGAKPSRPSSPLESLDPPHSVTNACSPLTLMARLLVLLKMAAMTGKSSFLMVLKSS